MNNTQYHIPVLLHESIDGLNIHQDGVYVDVTFGGGGHSKEILSRLGDRGKGRLYSFDQDESSQQNILEHEKFTFVRSNFRYLRNFMSYYGVNQIDGLLADLGVSSHHFDSFERGFSFRSRDNMLDMRMNRFSSYTAAAVLNEYDEEQLANIFYHYGEFRSARLLAKAVVQKRMQAPFHTVGSFIDVLTPFVRRGQEKKTFAQVFQALRIEVNEELDALKDLLKQAEQILKPGGRLVVITYHSLEDRLVKNFIKSGNFEGNISQDIFGNIEAAFKMVNNKVIIPSLEEQENNSRSRSAKMRIAEKRVRMESKN